MDITRYIPNKIKQSPHCCVYCGKSYKTRINLDKHIILCEVLDRCKRQKPIIEEEINLPSQKQMYQIILDLTIKYNKLEEKVNQMTKWIDKKKKKINVLDWLNINIKPDFVFDDLTEKIHVLESDIAILMQKSVIDVYSEILSRDIFKNEDKDKYPIFCFEQKNNTIYVFNMEKMLNTYIWIELSREKLIYFMNKIHSKITGKLIEWKEKQTLEKIYTEKKSEIYNKSMLKLMETDFKQDTIFNKAKSIIYGGMKIDIKALIEYEFEY